MYLYQYSFKLFFRSYYYILQYVYLVEIAIRKITVLYCNKISHLATVKTQLLLTTNIALEPLFLITTTKIVRSQYLLHILLPA